MGSTKKGVKHLNTHTSALQAAIANLEQFANKNESAPIAHIAELAVNNGKLVSEEQSNLQKTIALARCFVSALFSSKAHQKLLDKKGQVQDVVLRAIDVVKRNHLLIEELRKGSPEEQQLAATTLAAIKKYNAVIEQNEQSSVAWSQSIVRFFYKYSGLSVDETLKENRIDLPRFHTIHCEPSDNGPNQKICHAFQSHVAYSIPHEKMEFSAVMLTKMMADPLSKQETDLLRMKANTLLKHHNIRFNSMAEALQAIKAAPIYTTVDEQTSIATLRLILTLIPGTAIEIHGAFQRDQNNPNHSIPLSEHFKLTVASLHSGFPHPLQYTGWSLENSLIPSYPHRLDQMPLFKPLYLRKQEAMKGLLPEGTLFEKARDLWLQKSKIFVEESKELLKLHRELCLTMLQHAPASDIVSQAEQSINSFFDQLNDHSAPMEYLAKMNQVINEQFIARPHAKLQEIWVTRADNDGAELMKKARIALAEDAAHVQEKFLEQGQKTSDECEKCAFDFVNCMGCALQNSIQSILLQHFSETFGFAPRMLTDFEQKLQISAFKQLIAFLDELDGTPISFETIKQSIESDIALFHLEHCDAVDSLAVQISHELEVYFNSRYYSSL